MFPVIPFAFLFSLLSVELHREAAGACKGARERRSGFRVSVTRSGNRSSLEVHRLVARAPAVGGSFLFFFFFLFFLSIHPSTRALNPSWALSLMLYLILLVRFCMLVGFPLAPFCCPFFLPVSSIYSLAIDRMKPRGVLLEQGGRVLISVAVPCEVHACLYAYTAIRLRVNSVSTRRVNTIHSSF